jgi:hypothetical protein
MKLNVETYVRAIHGQHISIREPTNSDSFYHNHEGPPSVPLMSIVTNDYEFIAVDGNVNGWISDGSIMKHSDFRRLSESGNLGIPHPTDLLHTTQTFPCLFVTDKLLRLTKTTRSHTDRLLWMTGDANLEYRPSQLSGIVENKFWVPVKNTWIFRKVINLKPFKVNRITSTYCYFHNALKQKCESYLETDSLDTDNITNDNIQRGSRTLNITHIYRY